MLCILCNRLSLKEIMILESLSFYVFLLIAGMVWLYLTEWTKLNYIAASLYNVKGFAHMRSIVRAYGLIWNLSRDPLCKYQVKSIHMGHQWIWGQAVRGFINSYEAAWPESKKKWKKVKWAKSFMIGWTSAQCNGTETKPMMTVQPTRL